MTECKYCNAIDGVSHDLGHNRVFDKFYIEKVDGIYRIVNLCRFDDDEICTMTKSINYCPICGRKLGD